MKKFLFAFFVLFLLIIAGCASETLDPGTMYSGQTDAQIFAAGEKAMNDGDFLEAISHFEAINAQYPFSQYAQKAQLDLIYCYHENNDVTSTLASADHYIQLHPRSDNVDYAYYLRGLTKFEENRGFIEKFFGADFAKRDIKSLKEAFFDFSHIVRFFPHSQYVEDSRQHMIYIRNTLAEHQLNIARFYFDKKAYIAAINRAQDIVLHYQQSTSVEDAYKLMRDAYNQLDLKDDAVKIDNIIKNNFS